MIYWTVKLLFLFTSYLNENWYATASDAVI